MNPALRETDAHPVGQRPGGPTAALVVNLVTYENGKETLLARETPTPSDFMPLRDDVWLRGLRAGELSVDLRGIDMRIVAGETLKSGRLSGYAIELTDADGRTSRRHYAAASLSRVANRAAQRLLDANVLRLADKYKYYLTAAGDANAGESSATPPSADAAANTGRVASRTRPLILESADLAHYMAASAPLEGPSTPLLKGLEDREPPMPIFVDDEVWEQAQQLARRGGESESAAVFTGRLMRDTASPEVFMRLDACLEAKYATEEKFSVFFTGETWADLSRRLEQRRRRLDRPGEIILGSVHGHNFAPVADIDGVKTCEACAVAEVCTRTTAAYSTDDVDWHRSVFTGQPWAVLLVWGFNARDQEDWRLYGMSAGVLAMRSIRRLKRPI
jgi:hypothetical protein